MPGGVSQINTSFVVSGTDQCFSCGQNAVFNMGGGGGGVPGEGFNAKNHHSNISRKHVHVGLIIFPSVLSSRVKLERNVCPMRCLF